MKQDVLDKIVLLLVSQVAGPALDEAAARLGVPTDEIPRAIAEARRRLTVAADFNRDEQIGTAFVRLNDLYRRALGVQDVKTALAAQRELNKLMHLYPTKGDGNGHTGSTQAARACLVALGLGSDNTDLAELCRRAAARIVELEDRVA